jgi:hypothetical protein
MSIHFPIKTTENHKLCIERINILANLKRAFLNKQYDASTAFGIRTQYLNKRKNG